MKTIRTLFMLCLLALGAIGASSGSTPPSRTGRGGLSDAEIERTIRAKLAKSKINADGFTVKVQGGIATFEGKTNVVQHKGVATRMAKTAGATAVVNHIQVSDAAKKKLADQLTKGKVAQVKQ